MITHRLHTIRTADTIVVLHGGVMAEQGPHQNLLALDGIYAGLYRAGRWRSMTRPRQHQSI
jgi:ABC-type multidrug transport system fused ATPase/permease subunit